MEYVVLIPAYKPDMRLVQLVDDLAQKNLPCVVVDDGSTAEQSEVFAALAERNIEIVRHAVNQGKGRALKTGFNYLLLNHPELKGVVTADCDGQHAPKDIAACIEALKAHPNDMIIGARHFTGDVPFKSRWGNRITKAVYWFASGLKVSDTQTGLRGFPMSSLKAMMKLEGERYELEMNMLLALKGLNMHVTEVPIDTIYIDNNASSHFNHFKDGFRIYKQIFAYVCSSGLAWVVEYGLFLLLRMLPFGNEQSLAWVYHIIARLCSSCVNYQVNQKAVFHAQGGKKPALMYAALVGISLLIGTPTINWLTNTCGWNDLAAKIVVDIVLFFFNYLVQREIIFKKK